MPIQFPGGPSIYDQIGQGVKSVEDYRAIRDLATQRGQALQQGALGLLTGQQKADEYTRGLKEQDALRSLLGDATFNRNAPEARARVYQAAPGLADKVFQGWSAQDKSAADVTHLGAQAEQQKAAATKAASENANLVLGQFKQFIPSVQTAQDMEELTKAMYAHPIAGPIMASHAPLEKALAAIPQDPKVLQENLKKWAMGTTDYVKDQTTRQGHELTAGTSLATNAATNVAHVQTNAATVAEQRRAHNMQDVRSRETTTATMTKPFEVTGPDGAPMLVQQDKQGNISPVQGYGPKTGASKPLTDSQAKALGFGARMQEADKALQGLEQKGVTQPSIARQITGDTPFIGAAANAMSSPDQQTVEQVQRDFANAILRRESGAAISASEFDNAKRQYFAQPGDSKEVRAVKAKNRDLATRGVLAEVPVGQRNALGTAPATGGRPSLDSFGKP